MLLPALAGSALGEVFPGTTAMLRPLCTLAAAALMAAHCASYIAHSGGALRYAGPRLLGAVVAMHAVERRGIGRSGALSRCCDCQSRVAKCAKWMANQPAHFQTATCLQAACCWATACAACWASHGLQRAQQAFKPACATVRWPVSWR